jgi:hypothetical protein
MAPIILHQILHVLEDGAPQVLLRNLFHINGARWSHDVVCTDIDIIYQQGLKVFACATCVVLCHLFLHQMSNTTGTRSDPACQMPHLFSFCLSLLLLLLFYTSLTVKGPQANQQDGA